MDFTNERYESLREIFRGQRMPLAFVDLVAFDANIDYVAGLAQRTGKTLRIGTKSLRCEPLMRRILAYGEVFRGFLTYTVEETAWLADKGHDDFIVAYPTVQPSDLTILTRLSKLGKQVAVMVDCLEHLQALSAAGEQAGVTISACLEIDLAYRPLSSMHLGLRRSPLRTPLQVLELVKQVQGLRGVKIDCLMGYEGHIAGTSDATPGKALNNAFMRLVKAASVRELTRRRGEVVRSLKDAGSVLKIVNGGGSGSLVTTLRDPAVTEATIGSGLYAPGLFHHFAQVHFQPAAFFAIQVVRRPASGMVACQGGGYVASGPVGAGKAPLPVMPVGLQYLSLEGAGEVSTPLILPNGCPELDLGDPIFFQHAKAGELCERFNKLHLVQGGKIVDTVTTYRGEGMNFL
jgi:D-serine deaminase-like pyridoxal phosphate-dependent protein